MDTPHTPFQAAVKEMLSELNPLLTEGPLPQSRYYPVIYSALDHAGMVLDLGLGTSERKIMELADLTLQQELGLRRLEGLAEDYFYNGTSQLRPDLPQDIVSYHVFRTQLTASLRDRFYDQRKIPEERFTSAIRQELAVYLSARGMSDSIPPGRVSIVAERLYEFYRKLFHIVPAAVPSPIAVRDRGDSI